MSDLAIIPESTIVYPGDKLIVRVKPSLTAEQAADIKALLAKRLPELADIIVLSAVDEIVVVRTEVTS